MNALSRHWLLPVLLGLLGSLWLRWQPLSSPDTASFVELRIASATTGEAWFILDTGRGWNFSQTRALWLIKSEQPRVYRVPLPPDDYRVFALRGMPNGNGIPVASASLVIDGKKRVALHEATPPGATVPLLVAHEQIRVVGENERTWGETVMEFVLFTGLFRLLILLLDRRKPGWRSGLLALGEAANRWTAARPRVAICFAALGGVLLSCHPVIFAGRSFVSPNNGTLCLYDRQPTLPGAAASVEQWSSTDVYATLWAHLPYSVITHHAVLRDHELPLWNRYTHGGVTLLGQGQSMPGDPLFWLPVFAEGAAWAWDLRFILSKLVFAIGIGGLVWTSARHLPSALLLAVSASFLGFFAFRFNHPAFFSVCYAPWILFCWLRAIRASSSRETLGWALALIGANWIELNSGTAKEAAMLLIGLNATGLLTFFLSPVADRGRRFLLLAGSCVTFAALSAPLWTTFLGALARGFTAYDEPRSSQLPAGLFLGLFDELFYAQFARHEWHVAPSLNFLVLLGLLWAATDARRLRAEPCARAAVLIALPLLALVFGVIPPAWIDRTPFLKNIAHVDNTFTCVLLVPLLVLAGYGLSAAAEKSRAPEWSPSWRATLLGLGLFLALYLGTAQAMPTSENFGLRARWPAVFSAFFRGYLVALLAAMALLPWCARLLALGRSRGPALIGILVSLAALHFRHGMWIETKFDTYVMNPQPRVDLRAPASTSVAWLRAHRENPGRTVGFGKILSPGFNVVLDLESPFGEDAVVSRRYAEWIVAVGLEQNAIWAPNIDRDRPLAALNAMNVRYYLSALEDGARIVPPGLQRVGREDLEIFESAGAWPRAFFTDRLLQYREPATLGGWVQQGDGQPFAAVQEGEPNAPALPARQAERQIVPARDYRFTSNTTAFSIVAPAPGVAVLLETFPAEDCRAIVNGQPAPVLRVNHTFVGVALPAVGEYRIALCYWPRSLTPSLWVAAAGLLVCVGGIFRFCFGPRLAISASAHA